MTYYTKKLYEYLKLKQNPYSDQNRLKEIRQKMTWWDTSSLTKEEKELLNQALN